MIKSIIPSLTHEEFLTKVSKKFKRQNVNLKFKDEDDGLISIVDEEDWENAIDLAKILGKGHTESKLEIWVT